MVKGGSFNFSNQNAGNFEQVPDFGRKQYLTLQISRIEQINSTIRAIKVPSAALSPPTAENNVEDQNIIEKDIGQHGDYRNLQRSSGITQGA